MSRLDTIWQERWRVIVWRDLLIHTELLFDDRTRAEATYDAIMPCGTPPGDAQAAPAPGGGRAPLSNAARLAGRRPMSAQGRCASCRFWAIDEDGVDIFDEDGIRAGRTAHHVCLRIPHGNGRRGAARLDPNTPAIATDAENYAAELRTLPTFGCTLYEPKPEKEKT
ncbi:MAG TPA: hypothetical protein VMN56_01400 [Casimicrobiaceae bacterium]|nr:hypothetical protein [Casimicrobiaceae bacterium]